MRDKNRGGISLARIILLAGIAAAIIAGPLLKLKWHTPSSSAPSQGSVAYAGPGDSGAVTVNWGERANQYPAPPLALRLEPSDLQWWINWTLQPYNIATDLAGAKEIKLNFVIPGADNYSPEQLQPLCVKADKPFAACNIGVARLELSREADQHWDERDILLGKLPLPREDDLPNDSRHTRELLDFWTQQESATGRERIVGWACGDGKVESHKPSVDAEIRAGGIADARFHCYTPKQWWQRLAPGRFGLHQTRVLFVCDPKNYCQAIFFYHSRMAVLGYARPGEQVAALKEPMYLVAGWELLERSRLEAAKQPAADSRFPELDVQWQVCKAIVQEANAWPDHNWENEWSWQMESCDKAAAIALEMAQISPQKIEPMLPELIDTLSGLKGSTSVQGQLAETRLNLLSKLGQSRSRTMFEALLSYASYEHIANDRKGAILYQAWELALSMDPPIPAAQRNRVAKSLLDHHLSTDNAKSELLSQWIPMLERDGGQGLELSRALDHLASIQWNSGDFIGMKQTTDRLSAAYLAQPPLFQKFASAEAINDAGSIGVSIVVNYRNYALHESAFSVVEPTIDTVVRRMIQDLGPDSRWVKGAMFHQREVKNRRAAPGGTSIGGGFLG